MGKFLGNLGEEATLVVLVLTVIVSSVLAQEQSITINKPKRLANPWETPKPGKSMLFYWVPPKTIAAYSLFHPVMVQPIKFEE